MYIVPETKIVNVPVNNILTVSGLNTKKICPETLCPFNKEWCIHKQKYFDSWHIAVETCAMTGKDYIFYSSEKSFIDCPLGYKSLCAEYKQRQRD